MDKSSKKIIKKFKLNNKSKILDVGCGKAFILYEIKKMLPDIKVVGFDISRHGIRNAPRDIQKHLFLFIKHNQNIPIKINTLISI